MRLSFSALALLVSFGLAACDAADPALATADAATVFNSGMGQDGVTCAYAEDANVELTTNGTFVITPSGVTTVTCRFSDTADRGDRAFINEGFPCLVGDAGTTATSRYTQSPSGQGVITCSVRP